MAREPWEAGEAWRAWLLNKIGMTEDEAGADMPLFYDKARDVIRRPNQSGFRDVFKVGEKWQAKVYVGPKDQRHAGYFETREEAADEVLRFLCTGVPPPKPETRRGSAGREVRPRGRQRRGRRPGSRPLRPLLWLSCQLSRSRLRPLLSWACTRRRVSMARRRGRRP